MYSICYTKLNCSKPIELGHTEDLTAALRTAKNLSCFVEIDEVHLYDKYDECEELLGTWKDGKSAFFEEADDEVDDYDDYGFDEVGYDPYSGCYDADL